MDPEHVSIGNIWFSYQETETGVNLKQNFEGFFFKRSKIRSNIALRYFDSGEVSLMTFVIYF